MLIALLRLDPGLLVKTGLLPMPSAVGTLSASLAARLPENVTTSKKLANGRCCLQTLRVHILSETKSLTRARGGFALDSGEIDDLA
ncbi:hypothetical protein [Desulfonatronum parangueonense]